MIQAASRPTRNPSATFPALGDRVNQRVVRPRAATSSDGPRREPAPYARHSAATVSDHRAPRFVASITTATPLAPAGTAPSSPALAAATCWEVDDLGKRDFMTTFHRLMAEGGVDPWEALQRTRREQKQAGKPPTTGPPGS